MTQEQRYDGCSCHAFGQVRQEEYEKGLAKLMKNPQLQEERATSHQWPQKSDIQAASFTLDKPNLGRQRKVLLKWPVQWRKDLIRFKAVHLACEVREHFMMKCNSCDKISEPTVQHTDCSCGAKQATSCLMPFIPDGRERKNCSGIGC